MKTSSDLVTKNNKFLDFIISYDYYSESSERKYLLGRMKNEKFRGQ